MDSDTFTPPTKDSYVDEYTPTVNYGSGVHMYVKSLATAHNQRCLVEFDISDIPAGSTIDVATLKLYARYSSAEGRTYVVNRITGAWTELGVNWNNKPAVTFANQKTVVMVAASTWLNVDVKGMVQDALADGVVGFRLKDMREDNAVIKQGTFTTKEYISATFHPRLYVEWTPPVPPAKPLINKPLINPVLVNIPIIRLIKKRVRVLFVLWFQHF